jgi:hypothetical protein
MASFQQELQKLMGQFSQYAVGIPEIDAQIRELEEGFRLSGERNAASDRFQLGQAGMGRSVAAATTGGTRGYQAQRESAKSVLDLLVQHGTLKGQQQLGLLGTLAPTAEREANKPSTLAQLIGGGLQLAGTFGIPGLAGNPLEKMLAGILGQGGGNAGTGFANTSNFNFGGYGG